MWNEAINETSNNTPFRCSGIHWWRSWCVCKHQVDPGKQGIVSSSAFVILA